MNWKFGDNINTDLITPGRYNITTIPKNWQRPALLNTVPN